MHRPLIGITIGKRPGAAASGPPVAGTQVTYTEAVIRAGGAPVLLPRTDSKEVVATVVDRLDGLLLSGGGDVCAHHYAPKRHESEKNQDAVRDALELAAVEYAVERQMPLFGICRGVQVLNVALGGTLVQDIPSQRKDAHRHHVEGDDRPKHDVEVVPDTLLARVLADVLDAHRRVKVNSRHHQAVDKIAPDLRVNCRSPDGIIEGLESAGGLPVLAVQCHPEDDWDDFPAFPRLFGWFIGEARRFAAR